FISGLVVAGWPLLVRAQPQTKPTIVWLDNRPGGILPETVEGFRRVLAEVGVSEGRDLTVEYHFSDDHYERLPALADDLVRRRPAAIIAIGGLRYWPPKRRRGTYQSSLRPPMTRSSLA